MSSAIAIVFLRTTRILSASCFGVYRFISLSSPKNLVWPRLLKFRQTRVCSIPCDPVLTEAKVAEGERPTDLLVVVMVFRNNVPRPPSSTRAPRHPAICACHAAKFQRPCAMRLIRSIAFDRAQLNRNRKAANLGEHVKRNKETREPRTDRGLSLHRFLQPVSGCMNVVSVEVIEDFEVLFITFADLRCQDRTVQCTLGSGGRWPRIAGIVNTFGDFGDEIHWFFHGSAASIRCPYQT